MHLQQHFPYFLWYFSFLIFYILRTLIHKNQNIIWSFASFHAQIRYISGISCPMSTDHLQNNIWLFVGDQNMTPKFLCTKYCILWIKQECKRISRRLQLNKHINEVSNIKDDQDSVFSLYLSGHLFDLIFFFYKKTFFQISNLAT